MLHYCKENLDQQANQAFDIFPGYKTSFNVGVVYTFLNYIV
jgi:hypothetical protein